MWSSKYCLYNPQNPPIIYGAISSLYSFCTLFNSLQSRNNFVQNAITCFSKCTSYESLSKNSTTLFPNCNNVKIHITRYLTSRDMQPIYSSKIPKLNTTISDLTGSYTNQFLMPDTCNITFGSHVCGCEKSKWSFYGQFRLRLAPIELCVIMSFSITN